ncbi:MAG: DUF3324 domain-containing protein [Porphyromonadaceae bacterium]|nr:DUF3324 domain-containing protein [Porphyromonadaceae bacterium]
MKRRKIFTCLLTAFCSTLIYASTVRNEVKDDIQDKIELSRDGGTTRIASMSSMFTMQAVTVEPVVEAYNYRNVVTISVQNFRGSALVEIIGSKGSKQSFFEIYDMGFEAIPLNGIPAGEYTLRVTLGTEVFTGTFKKGQNEQH